MESGNGRTSRAAFETIQKRETHYGANSAAIRKQKSGKGSLVGH